ncbi:ATP-binding protein [Streptomyces sp. NBC_01136]|uniref:ATP-binding protein n=1 Tax=unclassified Streptomyces TaxID=2593676 RepID=UPI003253A765|nr:ATP-binding protein [Streptomyces sp. NBC_01136]
MNHATDLPSTPLDARYGINFTLGDHSARHLRRILRAYLIAWEMTEMTDSALLALTELVANVVRHVPDRRAALLMLWRPEGLRVEVTDSCPRPPLSTAVDNELGEGGRGLRIVDAVTDRWGWYPLPGRGKTVWFECHVEPSHR